MPDSRRRQHAARRRREAEEHVAKQGKPESSRSCKHKFVLAATCDECERWLEARKEAGLGDKPYGIPY